jgi:hypothetical protein
MMGMRMELWVWGMEGMVLDDGGTGVEGWGNGRGRMEGRMWEDGGMGVGR